MKKIIIILSLLILLTSCDIPSDYQTLPARDLIIGGKEYKVKNIALCQDSSSCNVWVIYPKNGSGEIMLSNSRLSGKTHYQDSTIIIE